MKLDKLSIIVPVYNEEKTIALVLDKLNELLLLNNIDKEIIVINDCSKDSSKTEIENYIVNNSTVDFQFFSQEINQGKGAAIHKGISLASGDYIVIQDADLELDPNDINRLIEPVLAQKAQIVYGSRFMDKTHTNTNYIWHILGNGFLTKLCNLFTSYRLTDMMTCYKLVPSSTMKNIILREKRFGFEPEITVKLSKHKNLKLVEVPISYNARTREDGKKIEAKDGFKVIWCILKYRFVKN